MEVLNLLGEKYLRVTPAGAGDLDPDVPIPLERTESAYDIIGVFSDLTTTTEQIDTEQLKTAFNVLGETIDAAAPEIADSFDGLSRLSQSISSRDEELQRLFRSSRGVTQVLADRSEDLVTLMGSADLVFEEVKKRKAAIHRLLVNARSLAIELRGLATDNQQQIAPALRQVDGLLDTLISREKELKATLTRWDPTSRSWATSSAPARGSTPTPSTCSPSPPASSCPDHRGTRMTAAGDPAQRRRGWSSSSDWWRSCWSAAPMRSRPRRSPRTSPRAVSVYEGSDVRILGVNVGTRDRGDSRGRVGARRDGVRRQPRPARRCAGRGGHPDPGRRPLHPAHPRLHRRAGHARRCRRSRCPRPAVPVELDRIYASLNDLTSTLGPNGVNADGTLNNLVSAGADALDGQGEAANEMLRNLSEAATTFNNSSGDLFATVSQLADFTETLATNDRLVRAFFADLADVVRTALGRARGAAGARSPPWPTPSARSKGFVKDNREALVTDVEKLTRVVRTIASERESLDDALAVAPVAIGNLFLAFNTESGSVGSRIGVSGNAFDADGFLCSVVQQSDLPKASKTLACELFDAAARAGRGPAADDPAAARGSAPRAARAPAGDRAAPRPASPRPYAGAARPRRADLAELLGRCADDAACADRGRRWPRPCSAAGADRLRLRRRLRPAAARDRRSTPTTPTR